MMSSTTMLPTPAKARITRELSLFSTSPPPGISCYTPNDTLTHLHANIDGPPDTPFEHGCFLLVIHIPMRYPFEPPRIRFLTPIHHPNIDSQGRICLDSLKSQPNGSWTPAISLPSLLLQIRALMEQPNAEDGLVMEVTEQYKNNYEAWRRDALQMTKDEATNDKLIVLEKSYRAKMTATTTSNRDNKSSNVRRQSSFSKLGGRGRRTLNTNTADTEMVSILSGNKRKKFAKNNDEGNSSRSKIHHEGSSPQSPHGSH